MNGCEAPRECGCQSCLIPVELDLVVSCLMWVPRTSLGSFGRTLLTLVSHLYGPLFRFLMLSKIIPQEDGLPRPQPVSEELLVLMAVWRESYFSSEVWPLVGDLCLL